MEETIGLILSWSYVLVSVILIILACTRKGLRGKAWLIAHLGATLAVMLLWRLVPLLERFEVVSTGQFYRMFALTMSFLGFIAFSLLVPYVLIAPIGSGRGRAEAPERTRPITIGEALFSFRGRMSRRDYWLKGFLIMFPIGIFNNILAYGVGSEGALVVSMIIGIASMWPGLAIVVKRLHDRNRSGWFVATALIPIANIVFSIWILIEVWFLKGTSGPNRFGNDPVALAAAYESGRDDGGAAVTVGNSELEEWPLR